MKKWGALLAFAPCGSNSAPTPAFRGASRNKHQKKEKKDAVVSDVDSGICNNTALSEFYFVSHLPDQPESRPKPFCVFYSNRQSCCTEEVDDDLRKYWSITEEKSVKLVTQKPDIDPIRGYNETILEARLNGHHTKLPALQLVQRANEHKNMLRSLQERTVDVSNAPSPAPQ